MARHVGFGFESTWGTSVVPTKFVEALSDTLRLEKGFDRIETIRGASLRKLDTVNQAVRGDINVKLNYQTIDTIMHMILGSTDNAGAAPYTHTSPASTGIADRPPVTIETQRDSAALTWRYEGCILTAVSLNFPLDASGDATLTFLGEDETTGTKATPSWPDFDTMAPHHVTVTVDTGGQAAKNFSLTITRPADEAFILGQKTLGREPKDDGVITVAGSFDVIFEDLTEYNKFYNDTQVDIAVAVASGGTETLTINMNKVHLLQATPPVEGRSRLVATYEFESIYDTDATENIQTVVRNDQATVT